MLKILTFWEKKKKKLEEIESAYRNYTGEIVVISDLHIPYLDEEAFDYVYNYVSKRKNDIVIAGDLITFDKFSRYLYLNNKKLTPKIEIEIAKKYIEKLLKLNKNIIYLIANHELRLHKFLMRTLGGSYASDLIELGLEYEKFFQYNKLKVIDNWFIKIGDCIISHPEATHPGLPRPPAGKPPPHAGCHLL
ncbi:MAG: metallophosphoesterase family protein, partial [Endomicrobiia bacterium]